MGTIVTAYSPIIPIIWNDYCKYFEEFYVNRLLKLLAYTGIAMVLVNIFGIISLFKENAVLIKIVCFTINLCFLYCVKIYVSKF